jgi:hypothetical protein
LDDSDSKPLDPAQPLLLPVEEKLELLQLLPSMLPVALQPRTLPPMHANRVLVDDAPFDTVDPANDLTSAHVAAE